MTYRLDVALLSFLFVACGDDGGDELAIEPDAGYDAGATKSNIDAGDAAMDAALMDSTQDASRFLVDGHVELTDASCVSGLDCASGYCNFEAFADAGLCVAEAAACSNANTRCNTDADCCFDGNLADLTICVGGFCVLPPL